MTTNREPYPMQHHRTHSDSARDSKTREHGPCGYWLIPIVFWGSPPGFDLASSVRPRLALSLTLQNRLEVRPVTLPPVPACCQAVVCCVPPPPTPTPSLPGCSSRRSLSLWLSSLTFATLVNQWPFTDVANRTASSLLSLSLAIRSSLE